jgi:hypothetical protein
MDCNQYTPTRPTPVFQPATSNQQRAHPTAGAQDLKALRPAPQIAPQLQYVKEPPAPPLGRRPGRVAETMSHTQYIYHHPDCKPKLKIN